ncbi:hypothetical protein [Microbispora sp. NPDC046933]
MGAFLVQFVWTGQAGDLLLSTVIGVLTAAVVAFEFGGLITRWYGMKKKE